MVDSNTRLRYLCLAIYAVFGVSCVLQFSVAAMLVGTALMTVALIAAHIGRKKAQGTPYESHFQWLVRTFWIGGGVYMPIMTVAATVIVFSEMDQTAVREAAEAGETSIEELTMIMLKANQSIFMMVYLSMFLPFTGWWVYRCVSGARRLLRGEVIPEPERWI